VIRAARKAGTLLKYLVVPHLPDGKNRPAGLRDVLVEQLESLWSLCKIHTLAIQRVDLNRPRVSCFKPPLWDKFESPLETEDLLRGGLRAIREIISKNLKKTLG
jgi:hypothetical protein